MPHQYGIPGYGQTPPSPPTHPHGGALIPRLSAAVSASQQQQQQQQQSPSAMLGPNSVTPIYRGPIEERRLTREAMEKYLRDRNNMIIVILHAKVIIYSSFNHHQRASGEVKCVFLC